MSATSSIPTRWTRRLVVQFLAPTLAALLAVLVATASYVSTMLQQHQVTVMTERLLAEAREATDVLPWSDGVELDRAAARVAANLDARVTVIAADGRVLGESSEPSAGLENHAGRPEVQAALAQGAGSASRRSTTVGAALLYAAVRQEARGVVRVVRVAAPMAAIEASAAHLRWSIVIGLCGAVVVGMGVALALSRRLLRRIQRLVAYAGLIAADEPTPYLGAELPDELGQLESQLADMAQRIAGTIATLRMEQERQEAILRGMVEGVVVTDLAERVVLLNARAQELLGVTPVHDAGGRPLIELVREPSIADILRDLNGGRATVSRDASIGHRTLQVNAARLDGGDGRPIGAVLVLHDVTELRRLEVVRRDFVANVSHELRTPLTAIKGYAETLLGPAGDDRDTRLKFLAVIDRHSERLGRLIDDLLALSDLELGRMPMRVADVAVGPVVDDVCQILAERIRRSDVTFQVVVEPNLPAVRADGDRLRQVLINLVENAIKYTPAGGEVTLRVGCPKGTPPAMIALSVEDTGVGIPAQDLPRLTERFFRVDKARSRDMGGTGLGLAIVKHIVQTHGGSLSINSTYGQGTTVTVWWPQVNGAGATTATAAGIRTPARLG